MTRSTYHQSSLCLCFIHSKSIYLRVGCQHTAISEHINECSLLSYPYEPCLIVRVIICAINQYCLAGKYSPIFLSLVVSGEIQDLANIHENVSNYLYFNTTVHMSGRIQPFASVEGQNGKLIEMNQTFNLFGLQHRSDPDSS